MSELLFTTLQIRAIELRNRLAVSPMCQYSAEDGFANNWHLVHLGSRAVGGAGLIITEATAISPEGRISPGDLGIWKDEHIPALKNITQFIRQQGSIPGIQLAHAGRKASHAVPWAGNEQLSKENGSWQTIAPSAIPFYESEIPPREMDIEDIEKLIADFKAAAIRAEAAGFQVIEIHAAHGYLLNEFMSPLSNQRSDEYGGSFENRVRLLQEVAKAIREVWPADYPVFVRISATDWTEGGWTIEDSVKLGNLVSEWGIDLIDCSSGGNVPRAKISVGPLYQAEFAAKVRKTGILTGAVGMINTVEDARSVLQNEQADLVLMARQQLRDPYFPLHAANALGIDIPWPKQYERAKK